MNKQQMLGMVVAGLLVVSASSAWPSEADELRDRAEAIQREAVELAEQGRIEEAGKLKREALKLLESAERGGKKEQGAPRFDPYSAQLEANDVELRNLQERAAVFRETVKAIQREAAELAERGHTEEAEKLNRKVFELSKAAAHGDTKDQPALQHTKFDLHIEELEARASALRKLHERLSDDGNSKREQLEAKERLLKIERELDQLRGQRKQALADGKQQFGPDVEQKYAAKIDAAGSERIQHITTAAEHLEAAGIHDIAGHLRSKAVSMKQELAERIKRLKEEAAHRQANKEHGTDAEVVELRQLVKRLQEEIKELREQAKKR